MNNIIVLDIEFEFAGVVDWCGGCTIVGTPGHIPGHISVYVNQEKVMITGDAALLAKGKLMIANPQFTLDMKFAKESLRKIITYGAKEIICYHGGKFIHK